jgi:hypothetical protein
MKNLLLIIISIWLLFLFLPLAASCNNAENTQTAASLSFHMLVTDKDGHPLSGAKVVSEDQPAGQFKISALTDNSGNVVFKGIKTGDYKLNVSRFDYNLVEIAITITSTNSDLTIKMTPTATTSITPTTSPVSVTFDQLINQPDIYNNQFVVTDGFYFSGFEIAALAFSLIPATYNPDNVTPSQPLIWITGNLGQSVYDNLQQQNNTPSGYPERFGKVRITGQFQYGNKYGHLDAYKYQITVTQAEILE